MSIISNISRIVHSQQIDYRTMKFIIGMIAIFLAFVTNYLSQSYLESISESYYKGDWPRNIFIGCLFIIAAFLFAYNGNTLGEKYLSKVASISALGVALFPCECGYGMVSKTIQNVHFISAAIMFIVLALICLAFYSSAIKKGHLQAKCRAVIYIICFIFIILSMLLLAIDVYWAGVISQYVERLVFYSERAALIAFGISWLTASHILPVLNDKRERYSLI